jgi:hypothetical protein
MERREDRKRLTNVHNAMLQRCYNTADLNYREYGGRGIDVEEHLRDTGLFVTWSLSSGYEQGLTLDRVDNSRGYYRDNLRWTTQAEQNRNRRNNVRVHYAGKEMCFTDYVQYYTYLSYTYARKLYAVGKTLQEISAIRPKPRGRRAEGLRSGKLRPDESVHGRKFHSP